MTLVSNWPALWKSYTVLAAFAGLALPEVLQFVADHTELFGWMDDDYKMAMRMACLVLIPILRAIKQPSLSKPEGA